MWVDIVASMPVILYLVWQRQGRGPILPITFEKRDYMDHLWSSEVSFDGPNKVLFLFYTFDVGLTLCVIGYHMLVARHPKYYITIWNKIAIIAHIIGGTCGILGLFIGLLTGHPVLILVAICVAAALHLPTILWQLRSLHGRREVMIPSYLFIVIGLANSYVNVITLDLQLKHVVKAGMCLHIFSWCRLLLWWGEGLGMDPESMYDRMVVFAGVVHLPFIADHWGGAMFVIFIYWWNTVFTVIQPFPRELLSVNRNFHDTFPDTYKDPDGKFFMELIEEYQKEGMQQLDAVQHAAYDMLRNGDEGVNVSDLARLIESWGVPQSDKVAHELFHAADVDNDGKISFAEFTDKLSFIWQNVRDNGQKCTRAQLETLRLKDNKDLPSSV